MKPIDFKHANTTVAESQDEYLTIRVLRLDTEQGEVIALNKASFRERLKILFTGRIWLCMLSFNGPVTPFLLSANRKDIYSLSTDKTIKQRIKACISKIFSRGFAAYLTSIAITPIAGMVIVCLVFALFLSLAVCGFIFFIALGLKL